MCRVISFLSAKGGIGKTSIINDVSKELSYSGYKVCVVDSYFGRNDISLKMERKESIDFKEYVVGKLGTANVINRVNNYLTFVKTNNSTFDYLKHLGLIKFFICEISEYYDFILIDVNCFCERTLSAMLESSNEAIFVINDDEITVRNTDKLIQKSKAYKNIHSHKLIVNMAREIAKLNGKCLNDFQISEMLKTEVIFIMPKFYKNNLFGGRKYRNLKEKLISRLSYSIITNKQISNGLEFRYKGIIGFIRKMRYAKYE